MKLSENLIKRGFVHQFTAESLAEIVDGEPRIVYHGIDPTADSAHAGNLVNWFLLRHLKDAGHTIIFLVGGGTGMIGDPKPDAERVLKSAEEVSQNVAKIQAQAERLIGQGTRFVNNADWLLTINLVTFLRDIGKYFTVNELIKKDAIASRLRSEQGISYTEFAYPLLQGYDYFVLHRDFGCDVQIGGSDQWGNMVAGVDLIRRKNQHTVYAVTTPLVVDAATGKKFGKSEGNAVWLDPVKTSPYHFYQFWVNVSDESVIEHLKRFTLLPLEKIESIAQEFNENPGERLAQTTLAYEVTAFVHGETVAKRIADVSAVLFGEQVITALDSEALAMLTAYAPTRSVSPGNLVVDVLIESGLATSKREARTFIEGGAVTLGDEKIASIDAVISESVLLTPLLLRRGKKQICVLIAK